MKLAGNIICMIGGVIWLIGYLIPGPEPLYAWPSWAFLPNLITEIGAAACFVGAALAYWPRPSEREPVRRQ